MKKQSVFPQAFKEELRLLDNRYLNDALDAHDDRGARAILQGMVANFNLSGPRAILKALDDGTLREKCERSIEMHRLWVLAGGLIDQQFYAPNHDCAPGVEAR